MDIRACRLCLSTESKLYRIEKCGLNFEFLGLTSLTMSIDAPRFICFLCEAQLMKLNGFREKCLLAQSLLMDLVTTKSKIALEDIVKIQNSFPPLLKITEIEQFDIFDNQGIIKQEPEPINEKVDLKHEIEMDDFCQEEIDFDQKSFLENSSEKNINIFKKDNDSVLLLVAEQNSVKTLEKPSKRKNRKDVQKSTKKRKVNFVSSKPVKEEKCYKNESDNEFLSKILKIDRKQKKLKDYYAFAKKNNMDLKFYSKEEQMSEIENRKETESYKNARFNCEVCYKGFISDTAFKNHQNAHNPARGNFYCDICHMYFVKKAARDSHIEGHAVKYTCHECGDTFTNICLAVNHFKFHTGVKFECEVCKKVFRKRTTHLNHMRNSHADVACALCGDSFVGSQGLQSHMMRTHREASKCSSCDVVFLNEDVLKSHLERSCGIDLKCGDGLSSDETLRLHVREIHKDEKRTTCELCSKTYTDEHALTIHWKRFHSDSARSRTRDPSPRRRPRDPRPVQDTTTTAEHYICDQCGKSFKSKQYFSVHQRLHTGERPYRCALCGKSFRLHATLKAHADVHSGARPFRCALCPRAFRQRVHRTAHMRTHTLEKPYSCPICEKRFSLSGNLREHTRTVHEGLPAKRRRKHTAS